MLNNEICKMVGCESPLFAFSHCCDVVAAVSRAGGIVNGRQMSGCMAMGR